MEGESADVKKVKSLAFAIRIVNLCKYLKSKHKDMSIISKQLFRSGTSIGANIAEAEYAESQVDFVHKLRISLKEASETTYWLKLLHALKVLNDSQFESMINDCQQLVKILTAIIETSNSNSQL